MGIGGQTITDYVCGVCKQPRVHANTAVPPMCPECKSARSVSYKNAKKSAMLGAKEFAASHGVICGKFLRNEFYEGNEWLARDIRYDYILVL